MAEFIEKTDTLNEGREKINAAIQDAEDAKTTAGQAVNTSNQAKQIAQTAENKADNVQEQFNQVVIEGDSSVEAAQARVDADGNTFTTLKKRLDTKETQFASQLAQIKKQVIYVDNPPEELQPLVGSDNKEHIFDETDKLQNILNYLEGVGGTVIFQPSRYYAFTGISIPSNVTILGRNTSVVPLLDAGILFNINGKSDIHLEGFIIDLDNKECRFLQGENVERITITKNVVKNGNGYGIKLDKTKNIRITDNVIFGFGLWGLYINGSNGLWIQRNHCFNNHYYDGIKLGSNNIGQEIIMNENVFISHNYCYGNGRDGIDIATNIGRNINITDNICYENGSYGINLKQVYQGDYLESALIANNILNNNGIGAIEVMDQRPNIFTGNSFRDIVIANNIIKNDNITTGLDYGEIKLYNLMNVVVKNNIINGGFVGVRGAGLNNSFIVDNVISDTDRCVFLEEETKLGWHIDDLVKLTSKNNKIINNDLTTSGNVGSICIRLSGLEIKDTLLLNNRIKNPNDTQFTILNQATNTLFRDNISGFGPDKPTTGTHSRYEVWINSEPLLNEFEKWLCTVPGEGGGWAGIGRVEVD